MARVGLNRVQFLLERLDRELKLIKEKDFEDYFFVISDMVIQAKKDMLKNRISWDSIESRKEQNDKLAR